MRILRVAQKVYPDVTGGAPFHVHSMSRDQAAMGHDVTVLTIRTDPALPKIETRDGYTVRRFDPTVNLLGNDISLEMMRYLYNASSFDVIHAHSHLYFSTNLAALKGQMDEIPLAITNHGLYSQTAPRKIFELYLKSIGRWTFNRADLVICYTDEDRRRLRTLGVESEIVVVPNGIDRDRFTPDGPSSHRIDTDGPLVLFVGRLVEGKRPQDVIEAVEGLQDSHPNVHLCICGDGPLRNELEAKANTELGNAVTFLGEVPHEEMPSIYRDASALILPSRAEGVPRTILEAFATGTPVVTSDLPQLRSIVEGSGLMAPPGDVDAFASGLANVLNSQTGYQSTVSEENEVVLDWDQTVKRTTYHLERLAE